MSELSSAIGLEVNPLIRSAGSWHSDDSPFAQEIRSRPMVVVIDRRSGEER